MGACPQCMGTDCAGMCAQGHCYAEEMQWQMEQESRRHAEEEAQWLAEMEAQWEAGQARSPLEDNSSHDQQ